LVSHTKEEHILRVFENRVLRRIFGPKMEELAEGWRRLHNEELHNLYISPNIIRVIKSRRLGLAGRVARMGDMRNVYKFFITKPKGKRPLRRPRCRWDDNIRMELSVIGWKFVDGCIWLWKGTSGRLL
jgi:hypothetical protein